MNIPSKRNRRMSAESGSRSSELQIKKDLVATDLSKVYGDKVILDRVSLSVGHKDKMGLVGPNGCGKSTLLKILAGYEQPDSGQVLSKGLKIGYLAQDFIPEGNKTIYEVATEGVKDIAETLDTFNHMSANFRADDLAFLDTYGKLMEVLEAHDGYNLPERIQSVLDELNIRRSFDAKVLTLSGGEIMRLGLAKILITNPDILLLDEPTNHLDLQGNLFLRDFLLKHGGGYLIVSHDRDLLDEVTASILELEKGRVKLFGGNYSFYREQKGLAEAAMEREVTRLSKELVTVKKLQAKERERAAHSQRKGKKPDDRDKYRAGFMKGKAEKSAGKKLRLLEDKQASTTQQLVNVSQQTVKTIKPDLKESESYQGKSLITVRNMDCFYGDKKIVQRINLDVRFGDKIALFGNNGAGKTTLIKGLLGDNQITVRGEVWRANKLNAKVLDQKYMVVDRDKTVLENMQSILTNSSLPEIRKYLARFLFMESADVTKYASYLSGGEIARLAIAMAVAEPIDLLVLDEPTNNLDISSIEKVETALMEFKGAMFIISHDLSFLRTIGVNQSYAIAQGKVKSLLTNPSDGESFKSELLAYLQT